MNTVAAESHTILSASAWQQQSSAAISAEAGHGWGLAAEFAASATSTLLPSPLNGVHSHSGNAANQSSLVSQDSLQDTGWIDVLRGSEEKNFFEVE